MCRSYKAEQLALSSWVEICCWDAATQQQFRLLGPVEVVDDGTTDHSLQSMRQEEWKKLNVPSVLQWYQNADRAPGHSYKPPVELPINPQVSSFYHLCMAVQVAWHMHFGICSVLLWLICLPNPVHR